MECKIRHYFPKKQKDEIISLQKMRFSQKHEATPYPLSHTQPQ